MSNPDGLKEPYRIFICQIKIIGRGRMLQTSGPFPVLYRFREKHA
jgi:hypothetical protein